MAEATALTYFIWFFGVYQWVFAAWLVSVPRPGPTRTTLAILFFLNGTNSFGAGFLQAEPFRTDWTVAYQQPWLYSLSTGADAPTAVWLIFLAVLFLHRPRIESRWTHATATTTLALTTYTLAHLALTTLQLDWYRRWLIYPVSAGLLIILAYGALAFVLGRAIIRSEARSERRIASFLFLAFAGRAIEFVYVYFLAQPTYFTGPWHLVLEDLLYLGLGLLILTIAAWMIWTTVRRPAHGRTEPTAVLLATLAIALYAIGYYHRDLGSAFGVFSLLTLVLIRPLFVGLAYDPGWTLRSSGILGMLGALFLLTKAFAAEILGQSFWQIGRTDLIALGMVILIAIPFLLRRPRPANAPPMPSLTHAQRLAIYLLETGQNDPEGPGASTAEVEAALGIASKNVAGEVRRTEKLLKDLSGQPVDHIQTQVRGVRGRKYFRLTKTGETAAGEAVAASEHS